MNFRLFMKHIQALAKAKINSLLTIFLHSTKHEFLYRSSCVHVKYKNNNSYILQ